MKWLRMLLFALLLAILAAVAASCADLLQKPASTPFPEEYVPTIIALTVSAGEQTSSPSTPEPDPAATESDPAAAALVSASPTPPPPPATSTPEAQPAVSVTPALPETLAFTATPSAGNSPSTTTTPTPEIPNAAIQFAAPGPLSRLVSPLELVATVRTVPSGSYHIELWAEPLLPGGAPRLLLREVNHFISNPIDWMFLDQALEFELSRVSELVELRILTYDPFGRPVAAGSVELLLLQLGENQLTPNGDALQPLVILEPVPNILIQGGTLIVTGLARPLDNQPLLIELIAADGTIAGVRQVFLTSDPAGGYIPFMVDVTYQVDSLTWVRLILSQSGARIPGVRILNSLEILLSP
jgi:hypothetical protein